MADDKLGLRPSSLFRNGCFSLTKALLLYLQSENSMNLKCQLNWSLVSSNSHFDRFDISVLLILCRNGCRHTILTIRQRMTAPGIILMFIPGP